MPTDNGMIEQVVTAAAQEIPTWFVCVMGVGIVFIGLACLIAIISLMGVIMGRVNVGKKNEEQAAPTPVAPIVPAAPVAAAIPNRSELVAAISVALAEELGADVRAIRIHSIKRV